MSLPKERIIEHLQEFADRHNGEIDAELLLDEILADQNHPLYNSIEHDPQVALRKYQLIQLRSMIAASRIVPRRVTLVGEVPAFPRNPVTKKPTDIRMLRNTPDAREVVIQAFERALQAIRRAHDLAVELELQEEVNDLETRINEAIASVQRRPDIRNEAAGSA